jgi:GntR family transcriptional repressor for pyruvate dehydrogenase complex
MAVNGIERIGTRAPDEERRFKTLLEIVNRKRLGAADEVFKALHDMIMSGKLNAGVKLPPQDKLAQQFGVSRNTVREAINKLTVMGLLTAKQGSGTVINITSASAYMASLSDHLLLQPATIRDFVETRVIMEVATVRLAVLRADEAAIAKLENTVRKQREAVAKRDVDGFVPLDVEFHLLLARTSGNAVVLQFLETVVDLLSRFIREVAHLPDAIENALGFHQDLIALIRSKDDKGAETKMLEHLWDVVKNIERSTGVEVGAAFLFDPGKSPTKGMARGSRRH